MQQETTLYEHHGTPQSRSCLKNFNIQDTMHLNKSKFGQSLRQSLENCTSSSISLAEQFLHNLSFLGMFVYRPVSI
jgi:hypothetical protein